MLSGVFGSGGGWLPELMIQAGIAQLVERNLAKVEVDGSNPFSRSSFGCAWSASGLGDGWLLEFFAGIAQLVERKLAKVVVDGSNTFFRSSFTKCSNAACFLVILAR